MSEQVGSNERLTGTGKSFETSKPDTPPPNTHTSILTSSKKASPLILPKQFHPLEIKYSNMRAYEGHSYPNTTVVECTLFGPNWVIGL